MVRAEGAQVPRGAIPPGTEDGVGGAAGRRGCPRFQQYAERYRRPGLARAGDVAFGLSTSGSSANVVAALEWAKANGLQVVTLTGATGGRCAELSDVSLAIPSDRTATVQEVGMIVYHILCEQIEAAFVG